MKTILSRPLTRTLLASTLAVMAWMPAQAEPAAVPVQDFSVFVDIPTGFAFVKTPSGWHFVRQIDAARLRELHPSTLVSVIQAGERIGQAGASGAASVL